MKDIQDKMKLVKDKCKKCEELYFKIAHAIKEFIEKLGFKQGCYSTYSREFKLKLSTGHNVGLRIWLD